ncbi:MAG: GEVED domain-containing protein [Bacteroidia bacterium]
MKKSLLILTSIVLLATLSFISTESKAQSITYREMMDDYSYNFYDVVEAAEAYFSENGKGKGSGWKGFERWRNENESKYAPSGDRASVDHLIVSKAYKELYTYSDRTKTKTSFDNGWVELGPWDANNVTSHYSPGIGRVETFWVDPANDKHLFVGSRSGGFWRTTDGGTNWENTTDRLVASGVPALSVNPQNNNEILIAVAQGGNANTHGIYRSIDGGATWSQSAFNPSKLRWGGLGSNQRIYKIAYHPTEPNQVFVCSSQGLYMSEDNLSSWTRTLSGNVTDVAFHPTNSSNIYAYNNSGTDRNVIKRSTNRGQSFSNGGTFANNSNARIYLSTSAHQPNHIYAASSNNVYKSANNGVFFTKLGNPDQSCFGGFAVSDTDVKNMIYGYVDLMASTDGGSTFTQKTKWATQDNAYIHADLRCAQAVNGTFYVGTDGYFAKSTDNGATWTTLNDGTAIREFYAVGISQGDYDMNMAGSQDNGTSILNSNGWVEWNGGDGMEALVHNLNNKWMIGSWQYGTRNYTRNGGLSRIGTGNPKGGTNKSAWEAPLLQDPLNDMVVYHFSDSIYKGDKFGTQWSFLGNPGIGIIKEAAIAESDPDVIACSRNSNIRLSKDGGKTWTNIKGNLPNYTMTDIAFDPKNENTIMVTFNRYQDDARKVFVSYDQGGTWSNITYNLNKMPLRTIVMDHSDSMYMYVGGEIGIYYKSKNSTTWTLYDNNLPNVTVKDLKVHYGSNTLRAATWGRGLYEYTLVGRNNHPSITHTSITSRPDEARPKKGVSQYVTSNILSDNTISSAKVLWSLNNQTLNNEISMSNSSGNVWESESGIDAGDIGDFIYFQVVATSSSGESESYIFNYELKEKKYCESRGRNGTGSDYITQVELNGTTKTSGQDYYGDFTATEIELTQDETYEMVVTLKYHWDVDSVIAWIDYNGDTDFSEDEAIIFPSISNSHVARGTFTVPDGALLNTKTRMRVSSQYDAKDMQTCGQVSGEVEDYSIIVVPPVNDVPSLKQIEASVHPNPSSGDIQVNLPESYTNAKVSVIDINGKVVYTSDVSATETIKVRGLSVGAYIVNISTDEGVFNQKLIVK